MAIRRITLVFALLCAVALSCKKEPSVVPSDNGGGDAPAVVSGNIQGTVISSSGDPIEGVVVSDGLHCTKTNAKGEWGLEADLANTDYVFVSTPSEYSAPLVDGTPTFWKFLKDLTKKDGKYSGVTFKLEKIPNPNRFTVLIYADPQPRSSGAGYDNMGYHSLELCNDMYKDMKEVVDGITGRYVYAMGLGDIVHEVLSYHTKHRSGMASTGARNYNVIGNHDHNTSCTTNDRDAARPFESVLGPANYSFDLGNLHFLVLDNMIGKLVDGKISNACDNGLTDEIWQWMQNDLSYVPKDKTIMVCAHSPMFRLLGSKDRSEAKHYGDYKALLHKYKKVYAWAGHTHTSFNYVNTDDPVIESHTLTRVTGELWTNEYLGSNGTPRGYVVFDYDNGDCRWKFKPMYYQTAKYDGKGSSGSNSWDYSGPEYKYRDWDYDESGRAKMRSGGKALDDSYQMQLFGPTLYGDGYIYANIFLWDELWKNPRFVTDGFASKMTKVTTNNFKYAFSMKEIRDYYVKNNPALAGSSYKFEANNTESMFCVRPNTEHGSGTVSVEDRFGNTYSSTITW